MFCWTWRRSCPSTTYSLSSRVGSLASSSSVRSRARLSGLIRGPLAELRGEERADPVDVPQRDHRPLVVRDVDTENTRHPSDLRGGRLAVESGGRSALPLLVAGVLADHVHLAPAADDLAVLADALHARSDLHRPTRSLSRQIGRRPVPAGSVSLGREAPTNRRGRRTAGPGQIARSAARTPLSDAWSPRSRGWVTPVPEPSRLAVPGPNWANLQGLPRVCNPCAGKFDGSGGPRRSWSAPLED